MGHSRENWRREGGGSVVSGGEGHPKIFELKRGLPSQKLRRKRFFTGKCTVLMGHSRENWRRGGGSCKIFQR